MQHLESARMKLPAIITLFVLVCASSISCQEEGGGSGGGEEPVGGHDQPAPDPQSQPPDNTKNAGGETDANGKKPGEDGYTQGFNQGVKPYSYGYNTGIKPYSYNFYQPYGGKPQVVEQGGPDAEKKTDQKPQPSPPPMPNIEFPADFSAFGLSPADLAIPPPPPPGQQGQARGQQNAQQRPPIPINFGPPPGAAAPVQGQSPAAGQTPPPFNYAEYGIPMDIGTATGSAAGSPFGVLGGGAPQMQRQPQRIDGDDFNIFGGGGGNNNGNSGLTIPVLEEGNNQNNQQGLAIPLFGGGNNGGGGAQNSGNDFNFANNDLANDFNVAASDFEPFNFQNFVPPEFSQTIGPAAAPGRGGVPSGSGGQKAALVAQQHLAGVNYSQPSPVMHQQNHRKSEHNHKVVTQKPSVHQRKQMYKASVTPSEVVKRSARSLNEQPHEKPLKDDPHSAWNILNMDPQYTNPNQGVYSYYPAYRMPS